MKKFVFLFVLFLLTKSFSSERVFFNSADGTRIVLTYQENHLWVLEEFLIRPGSLQEKVFHQTFHSKEQREALKKSRYLGKDFEERSSELFVTSESKGKTLWEVKESWNLEWEEKYITWLRKNFNKDFFVKYKLKTDCADVAFSLRWIFARIHALPAANTLAGTQVIFSQDSLKSKWERLPTHQDWNKDERFLTGLKYLLDNAYTGTLRTDAYPIELTKETFRVGTIHLNGGHAMVISEIDRLGTKAPIWKLSSTIPAKVRSLYLEPMLDPVATNESAGGFLRMRWPVKKNGDWELVPKYKMPFYSKEQYLPDFIQEFGHFALTVINRLGIDFYPEAILSTAASSITELLNERVKVVKEGYEYCLRANCNEGTQNYENYSTPSRDKRVFEKFLSVDRLAQDLSPFANGLKKFWLNYQKTTAFEVLNLKRSLYELRQFFKFRMFSSHPEDELAQRWGTSKESVLASFEKKIKRIFKKRNWALSLGTFCVKDSKCQFDSSPWKKHHTYVLDKELREYGYAGYFFLLDRYGQSELDRNLDKDFTGKVKKIPAFLSDPIFPRKSRQGGHVKEMIHLGAPKRFIEIEDNIFVKDDKLIELAPETVLVSGLGKWILHDDTQGLLVTESGKNLKLIDLASKSVSWEFKGGATIESLHWLGGGHLGAISSHVTKPSKQVQIFTLKNRQLVLTKEVLLDLNFSNSNISSEIKRSKVRSVFFTNLAKANNETRDLWFEKNGKLEFLNLKFPKDDYFFLHQSKTHFLYEKIINEKRELTMIRKKDKTSCLVPEVKGFYLNHLGSKNLLILKKDDDDSYEVLAKLEDSCEIRVLKNFMTSFVSIVQRAGTTFIYAAQDAYLFQDDESLEKLPLPPKHWVFFDDKDHVIWGNDNLSSPNFSFTKYDLLTKKTIELGKGPVDIDCRGESSFFSACPDFKGLKLRNYYQFVENMTYTSVRGAQNEVLFTKASSNVFQIFSSYSIGIAPQKKLESSSYFIYRPVGELTLLYAKN